MFLMEFYHSLMNGIRIGKGMKQSRSGNYPVALNNFYNALDHAEKSNNIGLVAFALEILAQTFYKMGRFEDAISFARRSLDQLRYFEDPGDAIVEAVGRVEGLIELAEDPWQPVETEHVRSGL